MKMKYRLFILVTLLILTVSLSACAKNTAGTSADSEQDNKISVVTTIFPQYDFIRQIAGDHVKLEMLLSPGAESHSYEPTPQDILDVQNSDLFVYVGGDSDNWVDEILSSMDQDKMHIVTLMDCVTTVEEETIEGMEAEEDGEEEEGPELDEHVWTSPQNAVLIVEKLRDALCEVDPDNAKDYKANAESYIEKLNQLDQKFKDVVENSVRKEIVLGDRFPFRYFVDAYGLSYYAAFPGCSTETEASASTVAFLIDKVKEDKIPVVFHIELSNEQMCDSICDATGAKKELLNAIHNISQKDFDAGVTYIDLMEHNVEVLKEALN
jgi:zinc transport system substrate-binding protein